MTDVGFLMGEGWIFLIYTLLVMMRMAFHKVISVKVYGVEYGIFIVLPGFAGGSPLVRTAITKQVARCYQKLYSPTWSGKTMHREKCYAGKGFQFAEGFPFVK